LDNVMVRVTVAVDILMSVTVFDPLADTNKCPSAMIAIPGLAPTGIVDPTKAPVDGLNRCTCAPLKLSAQMFVPS
jgi:hypothetical protein